MRSLFELYARHPFEAFLGGFACGIGVATFAFALAIVSHLRRPNGGAR